MRSLTGMRLLGKPGSKFKVTPDPMKSAKIQASSQQWQGQQEGETRQGTPSDRRAKSTWVLGQNDLDLISSRAAAPSGRATGQLVSR